MDAVAEIGREERNQRVSIIFSLGVENEQADAGRDGRARLVSLHSQARTESWPRAGLSTILVDTESAIQYV